MPHAQAAIDLWRRVFWERRERPVRKVEQWAWRLCWWNAVRRRYWRERTTVQGVRIRNNPDLSTTSARSFIPVASCFRQERSNTSTTSREEHQPRWSLLSEEQWWWSSTINTHVKLHIVCVRNKAKYSEYRGEEQHKDVSEVWVQIECSEKIWWSSIGGVERKSTSMCEWSVSANLV